nr:signal recognition particle receptor subunit alpha [Spiroplasma endosymbiont of Phyllotreta cruciferae]
MIGDFLANRLKKSIEKNMKKSTLTSDAISETMREIRLALLEADVNNEMVKDFIKAVETKARGEYISYGLNASQMMVKIVHEELVNIFGKQRRNYLLLQNQQLLWWLDYKGVGKRQPLVKLPN